MIQQISTIVKWLSSFFQKPQILSSGPSMEIPCIRTIPISCHTTQHSVSAKLLLTHSPIPPLSPILTLPGTCQITLYASGPSAPELDHYLLSPSSLRKMAGYLLQSCLLATGAGGFITSGLQNTLSTITQPNFSHLQKYRKPPPPYP